MTQRLSHSPALDGARVEPATSRRGFPLPVILMDLFSRPTVHLAVLDGLRAVAVLKIILRHTRLHARGLIETQGVSE